MSEEVAEKVEWVTSAAKAANGNRGFIAALKRCATQSQSFSVTWQRLQPEPFLAYCGMPEGIP